MVLNRKTEQEKLAISGTSCGIAAVTALLSSQNIKHLKTILSEGKIDLSRLSSIFLSQELKECILRDFIKQIYHLGIYEQQGLKSNSAEREWLSNGAFYISTLFSPHESYTCIEYGLVYIETLTSDRKEDILLVYLTILHCFTLLRASESVLIGEEVVEQILKAENKVMIYEEGIAITYVYSDIKRKEELIIKWAQMKASGALEHTVSSIFPINAPTFFYKELRYMRSVPLLTTVIRVLRDHRVLYEKIWYLTLRLNKRDLSELIASSFDQKKGQSEITDSILRTVNDEDVLKDFIIAKGYSTPLFFEICHTIDIKYAQAFVYSSRHISKISNDDLKHLIASKYISPILKSRKAFKRLVGEAAKQRRGMTVSASQLVHLDAEDAYWRALYLHCRVFPDENILKKAIHKEISKGLIPRARAKELLQGFTKHQDTKLLMPFYEIVRELLLAKLVSYPSVFYIKCLRILHKKSLLTGSALEAYNRFLMQLDEKKAQLRNANRIVGLVTWYSKSLVSISNEYKKFTFHANFVICNKKRTILLKLNGHSLIYYQDGYIYSNTIKIPLSTDRGQVCLKIEYVKGHIHIESQKIKHPPINEIRIDESFCGFTTHLLYYYGNSKKIKLPAQSMPRIDFFRKVVVPLERYLFNNNKSGLVLCGEHPYVINSKIKCTTKSLHGFVVDDGGVELF